MKLSRRNRVKLATKAERTNKPPPVSKYALKVMAEYSGKRKS